MIHFMKIVGVEWYEWVGQCQKVPSILILDETQTIYEDVNKADESMKGTGTAVEFWGVIKCAFKGQILVSLCLLHMELVTIL
ncbi:uncharacterized protein OCT59_019344 [Rhizophagus irregularis]|uniref:uncharacterized protein n=1 Tax=Rhizophagus irregularis TaxID=588596 RepID=UPI0033208EEA|nr:hypothetical protein OCT59_019344 [Rhizophagus irregularis]